MEPAPRGRWCRRRRPARRRGPLRTDARRRPRPDRAGLAGRTQRAAQPRHLHRGGAEGRLRRLPAPFRGARPARAARAPRPRHRAGTARHDRRRRAQSLRLPRHRTRPRTRAAGHLAARRRAPGSGKTGSVVWPLAESLCLHALAGRAAVVVVGAAGAGLGPVDAYDVVVRIGNPESVYDLDLYGGTTDPDEAAAVLAEALVGDLADPHPGGDSRRSTTVLAQLLGPFQAVHGRFPSVPELRQLLDGAPDPSARSAAASRTPARNRCCGNSTPASGSWGTRGTSERCSPTGSRCSTGRRSPASSTPRGSRGPSHCAPSTIRCGSGSICRPAATPTPPGFSRGWCSRSSRPASRYARTGRCSPASSSTTRAAS